MPSIGAETTLEPAQLRVVVIVYWSALAPLAAILFLRARGRVADWLWRLYWVAFLVCALGWEIWFTYGLWGGDAVDLRRAASLSNAIPIHANWLLNSLADAGSIALVGVGLVWLVHGRRFDAFTRWRGSAFGVLLGFFLLQNLLVEMFLYHDQLAEGKALSWAPLAPTGPWWNPTLMRLADRTVTLQGQMPWLLMTPLFYWVAIKLYRPTTSSGLPEVER